MKRGVGGVDSGLVGAVVERRAGVGGEDDHRIAKRHFLVGELVFQAPPVQYLQEKLDGVEMRLLNLVKEQKGIRVLGDETGQRTRLGGLVAGGKPDQLHVLLVIRVRGHVEPLEGAFQIGGAQLGQEGLAHPWRAGKDKDGARAFAGRIRVGDDLGVEQALHESMDGVILTKDLAQELRPQTAQPLGEVAQLWYSGVALVPGSQMFQGLSLGDGCRFQHGAGRWGHGQCTDQVAQSYQPRVDPVGHLPGQIPGLTDGRPQVAGKAHPTRAKGAARLHLGVSFAQLLGGRPQATAQQDARLGMLGHGGQQGFQGQLLRSPHQSISLGLFQQPLRLLGEHLVLSLRNPTRPVTTRRARLPLSGCEAKPFGTLHPRWGQAQLRPGRPQR